MREILSLYGDGTKITYKSLLDAFYGTEDDE